MIKMKIFISDDYFINLKFTVYCEFIIWIYYFIKNKRCKCDSNIQLFSIQYKSTSDNSEDSIKLSHKNINMNLNKPNHLQRPKTTKEKLTCRGINPITAKQKLTSERNQPNQAKPTHIQIKRENMPSLNLRTKNQNFILFLKKQKFIPTHKLKLFTTQIRYCHTELHKKRCFPKQNIKAKLLPKRELHPALSIKNNLASI